MLTSFCDLHPAFARHERRSGKPDEEAALQGAGDTLNVGLQGSRVKDLTEKAVGRVVAPVGDEGVLGFSRTRPQYGLAA